MIEMVFTMPEIRDKSYSNVVLESGLPLAIMKSLLRLTCSDKAANTASMKAVFTLRAKIKRVRVSGSSEKTFCSLQP